MTTPKPKKRERRDTKPSILPKPSEWEKKVGSHFQNYWNEICEKISVTFSARFEKRLINFIRTELEKARLEGIKSVNEANKRND